MRAQFGQVRADRLVEGRVQRPQQGDADRRGGPRVVPDRDGAGPVRRHVGGARGRHDVGHHPADLPVRGTIEDRRQGRPDRPVDENPPVGRVEPTSAVDITSHIRTIIIGVNAVRSLWVVWVVWGASDRDVDGLEGSGEGGTGPGGERQPGDRAGVGEVRRAEDEQAAVVDVEDRATEGVGVFGELTTHDRRGDEQRRRPPPRVRTGRGRSVAGRGDGPQAGTQGGQDDPVAAQQRRELAVPRCAHERVQRAEGQPQFTQRRQPGAMGAREAQHRRVDATRGRPGQHVDVQRHVEDRLQSGISRGQRRVHRIDATAAGPVRVPVPAGVAGGQVDLGGDTAHPYREARAAGHHDGEAHVLGRPGTRAVHRPARCRGMGLGGGVTHGGKGSRGGTCRPARPVPAAHGHRRGGELSAFGLFDPACQRVTRG